MKTEKRKETDNSKLTSLSSRSEERLLKSSVLRHSKSDSSTAIGTLTVKLGLLIKSSVSLSMPVLPVPLTSSSVVWLELSFIPLQLLKIMFPSTVFFFGFLFLIQPLRKKFWRQGLTTAKPFLIRPTAICRLFFSTSSPGAVRLSALNELSSRARNRFKTCKI